MTGRKNVIKKHAAQKRKAGRGWNREAGCVRKRRHDTVESAMGHAKAIRGTWYSCPWAEIAEPHYHVTGQPLLRIR